ncbi:DoxX family protein [Sorangium sp. So ce296]|uniref:DoxX family protein n=1 Tax=Sorangium sp. So ce296 TaxID=3133296 RepID=UPI003F633498
MNDKARTIGYWISTGLLGLGVASGGVADLAGSPQVLEGMAHLGYPAYFATILGVWKVLGAVALLAPRFPRLKEWAYAGIFFDLTGAAASHAAVGDAAGQVMTPLVLVAVAAASWALRLEGRRLAGAPRREAGARVGEPALAT